MRTVISRFGFSSALIAFIAASAYSLVQILQVVGLVSFPVADILIYSFSLCIAVPFLLSIMALHFSVPVEKKIWSYTSLLLAVLYAAYACFVYVVQLATVVPNMINGNSAAVHVLVMDPHSLFWTLDALTYVCMGLSTLFGAFALQDKGIEGTVHCFFLANALVTPLIAFVYFFPDFSSRLLWIGSPWIITAPGSMLTLALYFRQKKAAKKIEMNYETIELMELLEE